MRKYFFMVSVVIALALVCGSAWATQGFAANTFSSDPLCTPTPPATSCVAIDGWAIYGWENNDPAEPATVGTLEWQSYIGQPGGAVRCAGYGVTDDFMEHSREGVYIDKVIPTSGLENIHVMYDIKTHVRGGYSGDPHDPLLLRHGDLSEQLTVFYSIDSGSSWTEIDWLKRTGGNGQPPLEVYNAGYGTRVLDLSSIAEANDNASFALRFDWQFNEGPGAAEGGDWGDLDNIVVVGHEIGSGDDTTPPGPVTGFTAAALEGFTNVLSWTNPADADYACTLIRYSTTGYPASIDDGNFLAEVWAPDNTCPHFQAQAGVTYYYSAFAHDAVPNYATTKADASVTAGTDLWTDSFEPAPAIPPYTLGTLDTSSGGLWTLVSGDSNENRVIVDNAQASTGVQSIKMWNHTTSATINCRVGRTFTAYTPANGIVKIHMRFKSPNSAAAPDDFFWNVEVKDSAGAMFGQWYGTQKRIVPRDAANVTGVHTFVLPGEWYDMDMVVDTNVNKTYGFVGGVLTPGGPYTYRLVYSYDHSAGDSIGRIEFRQNRRAEAENEGVHVFFDDMSIGQGTRPAPVINPPATGGEWIIGPGAATPTITWTKGTAETVTNYQLKIFTSDVADPETASPTYNSSVVPSNVASHAVGTALPQNTHLWAFVKEQTANGWMPWSAQGAGGFFVAAAAPPAPTVTAPTDTVVGCKPMVRFTAMEHTGFSVKITDNAGGAIWDDSDIVHTGNGAACSVMLTPGVQYKAYAQVSTPAGVSAWSSPSLFQVTRANETMDVRDMSEEGLLSTNVLAPNDMFGFALTYGPTPQNPKANMLWPEVNIIPSQVIGNCNSTMKIVDSGHNFDTRLMRRHKSGDSTDLNYGVTYALAVAVTDQDTHGDNGGAKWLQSTSLFIDKDSGDVSHVVGVRATQTSVGLLTDNVNWQYAPDLAASNGYRIIRLTGRNRILNDFTSTVWKLYVDDNETPAVTATGCMTGSVIDPDFCHNWMMDCITLGQGSGGLQGTWEFDWTAINTSGDYAPGEWDATIPSGGTSGSIAAAKTPTVQAHAVNITGPAVITKILSHTESVGEPPEDVTIQDGYIVQDVLPLGKTGSGLKIITSNDQGGTIEEGVQLKSIRGVMTEQPGGRVIVNPAVTIEGNAPFGVLAMSQKNIIGPCINQTLGSRFDTTYMMVRFIGTCLYSGWIGEGGTLGTYIMYIDDGSGAMDGLELQDDQPVTGIRCTFLVDQDPYWLPPELGDTVMVEGIASYENIIGGAFDNVRTILFPIYTIIPKTL